MNGSSNSTHRPGQWRFIADAFLTLSSLFVQQAIYRMHHRMGSPQPHPPPNNPASRSHYGHVSPVFRLYWPSNEPPPCGTLPPANQFDSEEQPLRRPCLLAAARFGTAPPQPARTGGVQVSNGRHPPGGSTTAGFVWYSPAIASFHARGGGKDDIGQ